MLKSEAERLRADLAAAKDELRDARDAMPVAYAIGYKLASRRLKRNCAAKTA
jgi:hypothetical protein